jgi:hypothetical protein
LHGSLNWRVVDGSVVRTGGPVLASDMAAIYPSEEKYDQSRRVPFVVLQDRFRRALAEPESLTLIAGYSFGDDHLNEVVLDAVRRFPRSEVVVFCHREIPSILLDNILPNLSVLAREEAVLAGIRLPWTKPDANVEDVWTEAGGFRLGDFSAFARFLARSRSAPAAAHPLDVLSATMPVAPKAVDAG